MLRVISDNGGKQWGWQSKLRACCTCGSKLLDGTEGLEIRNAGGVGIGASGGAEDDLGGKEI